MLIQMFGIKVRVILPEMLTQKKSVDFQSLQRSASKYVREVKLSEFTLKTWLLREWKRSKLPLRRANDACGVVDAATRKYFDQGHLW